MTMTPGDGMSQVFIVYLAHPCDDCYAVYLVHAGDPKKAARLAKRDHCQIFGTAEPDLVGSVIDPTIWPSNEAYLLGQKTDRATISRMAARQEEQEPI